MLKSMLTAMAGVLICFGLTASAPVCAEESALETVQNGNAHASLDAESLRRQANARYTDVWLPGGVAQQFEMYDPHSAEAMTELRDMGFTQVILDWPNLHSSATEAGLKVVMANWWTQDTKPEEIQAGIDRARAVNPQSLVGVSLMDEPGRNAPETPFGFYIDLYEQLKPDFELDRPDTRLEISHWGPMAGWTDEFYDYFSYLYEAADVMRIMPYPDLNEGPLDDVFFMVQRSRRLMDLAERPLPLVVILQAWLLPPDGKLPEIDELRAMAYQAMLSGSETVSFFEYNLDIWKQTPEFHDRFRELMQELTAFSRTYRGSRVLCRVTQDGIFTADLRTPSGRHSQLQVNTRRTPSAGYQKLEVRQFDFAEILPITNTLQTGVGCPQQPVCFPAGLQTGCCETIDPCCVQSTRRPRRRR
ncbi:MAG: hypothetical protein R3C49_06330 [Planctomycetaceae bacterium]